MRLFMRIRMARQSSGLSQEALAKLIGVSRGAVANWECTDGAIPATGRLGKIAKATGVSFEWLATGRGRIRPNHGPCNSAMSAEGGDPVERRLLAAFRATPVRVRKIIVRMIESSARKAID